MKLKENWGSLISLIIGLLAFFGGVAEVTNHTGSGSGLVSGPIIVIGAMIYLSAKKRRNLQGNAIAHIVAEISGVLIILFLAFSQNDLKQQIASDPVSNFIIPIWALIAYGYAAFRSFPTSGEKEDSGRDSDNTAAS